jgi:ferrous-iron efflux pump FieF
MSPSDNHKSDKTQLVDEGVRLRKWATYASVSTAVVLIVAKLMAYFLTDSVSLLSSLMDSTMYAFASIVMMIGVHHAVRPADEDHRYGHGKFEALASMTQAMFIAGSGVFLIFESLHRFVNPQIIQNSMIGIWVMIFAIIMTFLLLGFQRYVIAKTNSVAIAADSLHYKADLLINLAVIVAIVLSKFTLWPYFDPVFAIAIAVILMRGAWEIGRQSIDILADKELSQEQRDRIYEIVLATPSVLGMHDLRTRTSGLQDFIEMHMELDGSMSVSDAHDISDQIEDLLHAEFPNAEVMIHQDPHGIKEARLDDRIPG